MFLQELNLPSKYDETKLLLLITTWMNPINIILSEEKKDTKEYIHVMILFI